MSSKQGPPKVLSSVTEYKNPFMSVHREEIEYSDGLVKPYWIMERSEFSLAIPLFPDNQVLVVGQYRIPVKYFSWEFPMGGTLNGEDYLKTAKRELREETGYIGGNWKHLGSYFVAPGHNTQSCHIYLVEELKAGLSEVDESEFLEYKKIALDEVGEMINNGTIKDGPTIAAYYYLQNYLSK